jgi:hypothetical protein
MCMGDLRYLKDGEKKGSAQGVRLRHSPLSEVDPQRRRFGRRESDFQLESCCRGFRFEVVQVVQVHHYCGSRGRPGRRPADPERCVFITAVPIIKLFAWGEGDSGGHVLRDRTREELGTSTQGVFPWFLSFGN